MVLDGPCPDVRASAPWDPRGELERWSSSTGIVVEVWALPAGPLPGGVTELVRATILDVLEGLAGDGSVRCVSVALTANARGLRLTVSGDGDGLLPERLADRLRVRRAGFAALGGGLSANAVPGGGVTVSAALPPCGSAPISG
ncbi:hypothetical protein [Nonomuraea sp. NPDC005692]|uniref:hypothetical protein n=1 Tax=Nonomuraea sp. NPDC005692 TaxID=3157168 RepID=UPI0034012EC2